MYHLTLKSNNSKTGPIPVSTSGNATCPDACPFKKNGCYADSGPLSMHWAQVSAGARGTNWNSFCESIGNLPGGQLWRHNQAGDLPGTGNTIDANMLAALVIANHGKRGYAYTHKPLTRANQKAIRDANQQGFTINLSANNLDDADTLASLEIAPVVVILAHDGNTRTPQGRTVVQCPAQTRDTHCSKCGLCQKQNRPIVGFTAHGSGKSKVEAIARG